PPTGRRNSKKRTAIMNGTKSNTAGDRIRVSYRIFDYKAQFAECVAPLLNDLEEGFAAGRSNLTRKMNANIRSQKPPQDLLIIRGERFKELTKYRFVLLALHGLVRRWEISPSHGLSANPSDLTQTEPKGSPPPAVCRTPCGSPARPQSGRVSFSRLLCRQRPGSRGSERARSPGGAGRRSPEIPLPGLRAPRRAARRWRAIPSGARSYRRSPPGGGSCKRCCAPCGRTGPCRPEGRRSARRRRRVARVPFRDRPRRGRVRYAARSRADPRSAAGSPPRAGWWSGSAARPPPGRPACRRARTRGPRTRSGC